MVRRHCFILASLTLLTFLLVSTTFADEPEDRKQFDDLLGERWKIFEFLADSSDWKERWFLDGDQAKVSSNEGVITIVTSKGYAVLWTKDVFSGDMVIEYDFRRVDENHKGVNIIYIQATGDGEKGYDEDITQWSEKRSKAAMSDYYMNMHTYHVSYAAYKGDYVRGRRYLPLKNKRLTGTKLSGEYTKTEIFEDQQWIHVTVIKRDKELFMEFKHPKKTLLCHFTTDDKPVVTQGRVGLRLMPGRESQFKNFKMMTRN